MLVSAFKVIKVERLEETRMRLGTGNPGGPGPPSPRRPRGLSHTQQHVLQEVRPPGVRRAPAVRPESGRMRGAQPETKQTRPLTWGLTSQRAGGTRDQRQRPVRGGGDTREAHQGEGGPWRGPALGRRHGTRGSSEGRRPATGSLGERLIAPHGPDTPAPVAVPPTAREGPSSPRPHPRLFVHSLMTAILTGVR